MIGFIPLRQSYLQSKNKVGAIRYDIFDRSMIEIDYHHAL